MISFVGTQGRVRLVVHGGRSCLWASHAACTHRPQGLKMMMKSGDFFCTTGSEPAAPRCWFHSDTDVSSLDTSVAEWEPYGQPARSRGFASRGAKSPDFIRGNSGGDVVDIEDLLSSDCHSVPLISMFVFGFWFVKSCLTPNF